MRAQASVEFLILLGVLTLIFAILFNYSGGYMFYSDKLKIENHHREICNQVKQEIENALDMGPTYIRIFYLPPGDYNISISNYEVEVISSEGQVCCAIPINLSATLNYGKNIIIYNDTGIYIK